jgi:hypothetical protein
MYACMLFCRCGVFFFFWVPPRHLFARDFPSVRVVKCVCVVGVLLLVPCVALCLSPCFADLIVLLRVLSLSFFLSLSLCCRLNPTALACKSVHRVAPVLVDSPAARTLMAFIRSGKPVVCCCRDPLRAAGRRRAESEEPWGVFLEHAGDVFLHRLHASLDLTVIPYLADGGLKPLRDLRLRVCSRLLACVGAWVHACMLSY